MEKTDREYRLEWSRLWVPFVAGLNSFGGSKDVFLHSAESDEIRVKIICSFIASRYNEGLRGVSLA